jgi:hypothetical protein
MNMALRIAYPTAHTPPLPVFFPAFGTYDYPGDLVAALVRLLPTPALYAGSGGQLTAKTWAFGFILPKSAKAGRYTLLVADPIRGALAHARVTIAKRTKRIRAGFVGFPDPIQPVPGGTFPAHSSAWGSTDGTTPQYRSYFVYDDGTPQSNNGVPPPPPPNMTVPQGFWVHYYDNLIVGKTATFHIEDSATPPNVKEVLKVTITDDNKAVNDRKKKKKGKKNRKGKTTGKKKKK